MDRVFDHSEFRDHLESYLAGGLTAGERAAFESHAAVCGECAAALSEAMTQDAALRELFDAARPPAGFEDRLVERLRAARGPYPLLHPMVRRAATGVAAAVVLGGFGYVTSQAIHQGGLPAPWAKVAPLRAAGPSRGIGQGIETFANETKEVEGRTVVEGVAPLQTPADMASRFNSAVSDFDSDKKWAYKAPAAGAGGAESLRRGGAYFGEREPTSDTVLSYRTPSNAAPPGSPAPAASAPPPPAEVNRESLAEEKQLKAINGAIVAEKRSNDFVQRDLTRGYGFSGGGAGAGGFGGLRGTGADTATSAGRKPSSEAAAGNRPDRRDNIGLGLDVKAAPSADRAPIEAGKADAFRPNDYFDGRDSTAGGAPVTAGVPMETEVGQGQPGSIANLAKEQAAGLDETGGTSADPAPHVASGTTGAPAAPSQDTTAVAGRKIIRNGDMSFEVDGFDSAYVQITKIAQEEGGFVATTDSEKLANGKVKGTVTIRVPPDRLDTLVLKLRGLGDLKSSKLAAQDITKQYTDLESQLRASRAMEERLLNIIKTGKGEIKDLVEAEKQLGVYREKIEQVEGEIRYYNNLVSLSTLNVTLTERDIRTAATLSETEQVDLGVESQDVEKARADAIKAIEEAKGRIVESDLKKLEGGQFAARVVADVPPDAAGPLIDRMKQIGAVARLEVSRKQAAPEGTVAPTPARGAAGPRLERRDTRLLISLYNLANVAPRQTTNLNLAAEDVEAAYRTILDQVTGAGGRVVTSQLNRPRPDQTTGTITFEAPAAGADVLLGAVRAAGEVMRLDVSQNPDARNVTEAKRGFAVQVFSIASVAARETTSLRVAARGVNDAFSRLREAVRSAEGARILSSQLTEQDPANVTGTLDVEVRRADWAAVETALRGAGQLVSRDVSRSADAENTVDTKLRLQVVLVDEAALQPRESVTVHLAVADVPERYGKLLEALAASQARVLQSQLSEQEAQNQMTGTLVFDVRRENRAAVDRALSEAGDVVSRSVVRSTDTQNTLDDKVRLSLTLADAAKLAPRETTTLGMETADVEKAKEQIESLALSLGGRVVDSTLSREENGRVIAKVVADVPLGRSVEMVRRTRDQGRVQFRRDARDESVPQGTLARARVDVTLANQELIVESGRGLGATLREGLRTSVTGLLWSLQLIVVGLFLVAPWALVVYACWRLMRRAKSRPPAPVTAPAA